MLRSILQKNTSRIIIQQQTCRLASSKPNNVATVRLYRILARQLRAVGGATQQQQFLLQPPLNPRDYGRAKLMTPGDSENSTDNIFKLFAKWYEEDNDDEDINDWYQELVGRELAHEDFQQHSGDDVDSCLWTSREDVRNAVRTAFRASPSSLETIAKQRFAILAIQFLQDVENMVQRSSVSTENGLRVVATSSCIGVASSGSALINETKHRFAYRIRVENFTDSPKTVQILGRTWRIEEEAGNDGYTPDPVIVNAPTTGAVGHLPVLKPGGVFEYMSGCELATSTGSMGGLLHMAVVDETTPSAMVGDPIDAFQSTTEKFELPVQPFPLIADEKSK